MDPIFKPMMIAADINNCVTICIIIWKRYSAVCFPASILYFDFSALLLIKLTIFHMTFNKVFLNLFLFSFICPKIYQCKFHCIAIVSCSTNFNNYPFPLCIINSSHCLTLFSACYKSNTADRNK